MGQYVRIASHEVVDGYKSGFSGREPQGLDQIPHSGSLRKCYGNSRLGLVVFDMSLQGGKELHPYPDPVQRPSPWSEIIKSIEVFVGDEEGLVVRR